MPVPLNIRRFLYVKGISRLCKRSRNSRKDQYLKGFSGISRFAIRKLPPVRNPFNFLFLRIAAICALQSRRGLDAQDRGACASLHRLGRV